VGLKQQSPHPAGGEGLVVSVFISARSDSKFLSLQIYFTKELVIVCLLFL
jgi:hypothetical protein